MGKAAAVGHNSELTEIERKSVFFSNLRPIQAQAEVVKEANAELKRLRKLAKADGIKLADIDFALRCAEIDDPSIIPDDIKRQIEIADWFALPVMTQADLFADRRPAEERFEAEGYSAGMIGKDADSGLQKGAPEDLAWLKGWERAQAEMRDALASAMEKKKAANAEPDQSAPSTGKDPFPNKKAKAEQPKSKPAAKAEAEKAPEPA